MAFVILCIVMAFCIPLSFRSYHTSRPRKFQILSKVRVRSVRDGSPKKVGRWGGDQILVVMANFGPQGQERNGSDILGHVEQTMETVNREKPSNRRLELLSSSVANLPNPGFPSPGHHCNFMPVDQARCSKPTLRAADKQGFRA